MTAPIVIPTKTCHTCGGPVVRTWNHHDMPTDSCRNHPEHQVDAPTGMVPHEIGPADIEDD